MELNIDSSKFEEMVVKQAADQLLDSDDGETFSQYLAKINELIEARVDDLFRDRAEKLISEAIDTAIKDGFEREYFKRDQWGQVDKENPTSISKELQKLVSEYWSERVDKSGKPKSSSYNSITRAEYLMTQICAEDFSETMKSSAISITGALKDGLRNQMGAQMDKVLNELFKVKSLQDQGKVEKPY